MECIKG